MIYNVTLNDNRKVWDVCTIYRELSIMFFIIIISISSGYIYFYWYLKKQNADVYANTEKVLSQIKEIHIKNLTNYYFDDMINIKIYDWNLLKINKKSYKNIIIDYIWHITIEYFGYVNINIVHYYW